MREHDYSRPVYIWLSQSFACARLGMDLATDLRKILEQMALKDEIKPWSPSNSHLNCERLSGLKVNKWVFGNAVRDVFISMFLK